MGRTSLSLKPGINSQATKMQVGAGWVDCNNIRWKDGYIQKNGGWSRLSEEPLVGTCRGMAAWSDYDGNSYLIAGTEQRLTVNFYGSFYDVTPLIDTNDLTTAFSTTNTSDQIEITDAGHTVAISDWIRIVNKISIGGLVLHGYYQVGVIGNPYTVTAASAASATVSGAGTAALFTTTNLSSSVQVTLADHGLSAGETYTVDIETTVGGITLSGEYTIDAVIDDDTLTFTASSAATSSTTGSENGGAARVQYLLTTGLAENTSGGGFGLGLFGVGTFGFGLSASLLPMRQWSFGVWGQYMASSYTGGSIYLWDITGGLSNNPATIVSNAPEIINAGIFTSISQQQIIALGASTGATPDPLLIRWCDVATITSWTASAINQAGSFRLSRGSKIVGGINASQQSIIWTDVGIWTMQYIGLPYVYSFSEIGQGCGLVAQRACGMLGDTALWMSQGNFFKYEGGAISPIPCPVWDRVFNNLYRDQIEKTCCAPNSMFDEMAWFYPSLDGLGEVDRYVRYNKTTGLFDVGSLCRTAFIDQSSFGYPLGVDENGLIQIHETGTDNDLVAMSSWAETGLFSLSEGDLLIFLERMIPDVKKVTGDPTLKITVTVYKYGNEDADGDAVVYGPYSVKASTPYIRVRARGRYASIRVESDDIGSAWRLGEVVYYVEETGRAP